MAEKNSIDFLGRRIFFLYPSSLIQDKVIPGLAQEEFEVYCVQDADKLRKVLKKYPNSIVFANISEGMLENEWETWIKSVMEDRATADVGIGIIAYGEDAALKQKYTEQLKVTCGYTVMKPDLSVVVKQLAAILNKEEAKGRRKFVRVLIDPGTDLTASFPVNGTSLNGNILDISTAGFSCSFAEDPDIMKNSHFTDIQIRLEDEFLKVQGLFFGSRMQGTEKVYVFLFTQHTSPEVQNGIRRFTRSLLQSKMDTELEE